MSESLATLGLVRVGVAAPELKVADVAFNGARLLAALEEAAAQGCQLLVLPELAVTGYSCGDLFHQQALLAAVPAAVEVLAARTAGLGLAVVVGAPVVQAGRLCNAALFLAEGRVLGAVPKSYLPNSAEFYEQRWFTPACDLSCDVLEWNGAALPFGPDLLFAARERPELRIGIELCEDLWAVEPPSGPLALAGATLIANPSASPEHLAKADYRRQLVLGQSARCLAGYLYASAGPGESSTDLVYSGHTLIAENGELLAEGERFCFETRLTVADLDLARLEGERRRNTSFSAAPRRLVPRVLGFSLTDQPCAVLRRPLSPTPFVPSDAAARARRCREIFALQTTALATRLRHTGSRQLVVGVSGGLDSTLALLVAVQAYARLGRDLRDIVAVTMPGFGTTARTRANAETLAGLLGVGLRVIPIAAAVRQHFHDIGHPEERHDVVFENAQARERTQILMDLANQGGGLVLGTGDLSELALGWCTYNADHISMYGVNAGVPKTLVRYLVAWCAEELFSGEIAAVLADICATPVSPELLPPDAAGGIAQQTERELGPYLVHDFFLYHAVRFGTPPRKLLFLARSAFGDSYRAEELHHWLGVFYRRFFSQQFKRSCLPDGPKIGSVALSPRGDWRMPSDASAALWLAELAALEPQP